MTHARFEISLSLSRFPQRPFFQKISLSTFFFSKKTPFSLTHRFVFLVSPYCRAHANIARDKETNAEREKMDGARVLPFSFSLSFCYLSYSLSLSLFCVRALSLVIFLNISSSFFPNNNNNKISLSYALSRNDRRRGVPRQPARRLRRRRVGSFER